MTASLPGTDLQTVLDPLHQTARRMRRACTSILPRFELWYRLSANGFAQGDRQLAALTARLRDSPSTASTVTDMVCLGLFFPSGRRTSSPRACRPRPEVGVMMSRASRPFEDEEKHSVLFLWLGLHQCETETSSVIISSPVRIVPLGSV